MPNQLIFNLPHAPFFGDFILQEEKAASFLPGSPCPKPNNGDKMVLEPSTIELAPDGSIFHIKRGNLQVGDRAPIQVVCKYTFGQNEAVAATRLACEAERYVNNLRLLQGHEIPHFLGFYKGAGSHYEISCMILEDVGNAVEFDDFKLGRNTELMKQALKTLLWIHQAGLIIPSDSFNCDSVLSSSRSINNKVQYILVGFSNAVPLKDPTKGCSCAGKDVHDLGIGGWAPFSAGCPVMNQCCQAMNTWIPRPTPLYVPSSSLAMVHIDPYYMRSTDDLAAYLKGSLIGYESMPVEECKKHATALIARANEKYGQRIAMIGWPAEPLPTLIATESSSQ